MILLVDMDPAVPHAKGLRRESELPPPDDQTFIAACVRCGRGVSLERAVAWARLARSRRAKLPIILVARIETPLLRDLIQTDVGIERIVDPRSVAGGLPVSIMDALIQASIVPAILETWQQHYGEAPPELHLALTLLAGAAAVGKRSGLALSRSGVPRSSLHRALKEAGWPSVGRLWSAGRLYSVDIRVDGGLELVDALTAAGWLSVQDYRKAAKRSRAWMRAQQRDNAAPH